MRITQKQRKKLKAAGALIRKHRQGQDMTLEALSSRLNCSISQLSAIERGFTRPSLADARTLIAMVPTVNLTDWYPELQDRFQ